MSPFRQWRAFVGSTLAALLALSPVGTGLAEEVGDAVDEAARAVEEAAGEVEAAVEEVEAAVEEAGNATDEEEQAAEPSRKKKPKAKKKSRKELRKEREDRLKYTVGPRTAEQLSKVREHLEGQHYAEAQAALDKLNLARLSPYERALANRLYGYIAYGREEHDRAIEYLRRAIAEDGLPPRDRADVLFQISQIQGVLERWRDVIATLEAWFQTVEQPNSLGYFLMALSYYQLEDLERALPPAQQAVEIAKRPQQSWLQLLLAIHLTREDYAAAKPVLDEMIALYPNSGKDYWMQLSALHNVTGDDPRALGVLEIAYRKGLLQDDRDLRRLLQMMLARGIPYRAAQIFEKEMAAKRFEKDGEALELLSISWILAREPEKALPPLALAADLAKTGDLYVHMAQIHLLAEEWEEAMVALRKALTKGGLDDPGPAQLMLGIAYYNEHQLPEARSWFTRAQNSGPMREQAGIWLAHVDRELAAQESPPGMEN